jgi:uncharacterized protein (TIGR03435 family)
MIARMRRTSPALGSLLLGAALVSAQTPPPSEFEVVSIKRSPADAQGGGMQDLPDGTFIMRNHPIRSILRAGSPVPPSEVEGAPEWTERELYDITAKPPAGATRRQRNEMMRRMLEDRMKLKGHVEERERNVFALVVARSDGRLGPQLKPSSLDCTAPGQPPRAILTPPSDPPEARCGGMFGNGQIVSGGITFDQLVFSLSGLAGGQVMNRTGLQGYYALKLTWAPPRGPNDAPPTDDRPDFFTALQEQLGLKLQPEKATLPVFVVDSIERPSEN